MRRSHLLAIAALVLTAGCVRIPTGPSVMVLPGQGKNFDQFQIDDAVCHRWALRQCGAATAEVSSDPAVTGAAVGTVLGAATGAAVGAAAGDPAMGAAAGAGIGMLGGTAVGSEHAAASQWSMQRQYDNAYMQCMYAKGNQIPVPGGMQRPRGPVGPRPSTPPPPDDDIPPPPAGDPPPPPPGSFR